MARHPLVVLGRIPTTDGLARAAIGIETASGRITAVAPRLAGEEVRDHGDAVILPGAVDIHVHFRDPGHGEKEDFAAGTRAALHGGVTTVLDMPNTEPPTTSAAQYEEKRALVAPKAHCDWALWGGATGPGDETLRLAQMAPGLKLYLGESTGNVTFGSVDALPRLFAELRESGFTGVVAVHAEAQTELEDAARRHADAVGLAGHGARRPAAAELRALADVKAAIESVARAAAQLPFRVHVAHASTAGVVEAAAALGVSVGVTPHHLFLHDGLRLGGFGRVNPPLRHESEASRLYAAFLAGRVPVVESDHAPHTPAEKEQEVAAAPSGIPGVETLLPLLAARAAQGEIAWDRVAAATARAPARLLGFPKGEIAPGMDADLVVLDLADVAPIRAAGLLTRCGWTPFEGHPGLFPRHVYLRGAAAVFDGEVVAPPATGREAGSRPGG